MRALPGLSRLFLGLFLLVLMAGGVLPVHSQAVVTATLQDELVVDLDSDGLADPGDTIRYRVVITNSGDDATGVTLDVLLDSLTRLVPDSLSGTPLAFAGSFETGEEMAVTITLVGADIDGDTLSFAIGDAPANGTLGAITVVDDNQATVTYTPAENFVGTDQFTFEVTDALGDRAEAMVVVTVDGVNDAPTFTPGANQTVLEDAGAQSIAAWATDISAGATSESGQVLSFNVTGNTNTALFSAGPSISSDGTLTYTPADDAHGSATITVVLQDDGGTADGGEDTSASADFDITVTAVNDAPSFTTGADQMVLENAGAQTVAAWATDISAGPASEAGQSLTFAITANTNEALFSAGPAISSDGTLTYTPAEDVNGAATITVSLQDDGGVADGGDDTSATATFMISVTSLNNAPTFSKGADQTVLEDGGAQSVTGWATAISAGPSNESDQSLTFNVTGNTNTALFSAGPAISSDGTLSYTPAADANGSAMITIALQDDGGTAGGGEDTSASASFNIAVTAVNDAPTFTKGADETVLEDGGAQTVVGWATSLSAGPSDESGQTLTFNVMGNTNTALFAVAPAVSSDGTLTYTPAADASGTATITVALQDNGGTTDGGEDTSASASFDITVTAVNDAPGFTKGADETVLEDAGAQTVAGWATALSAGPSDESGQTLTFNVTGNTNTALFAVAPAISSDGTLTYTPAADVNGTATITITLQDDGGTADGGVDTSSPASFDITVTAVNDAPSFTLGADETVLEDAGAQTVVGWATAMSAGPADESGQTLTFNVTGNSNSALFAVGPAIASNGTLTYTPAADASGTATISVTLQDDGGTADSGADTSASANFDITVTAVNDAPSFTKGADETVLEDAGAQSVSGWATALSTGPADESVQTLSFNITGNTNSALFSAGPAIASDGTLTYTPAADANGTATITVTVQDDGGTANGGIDTSASADFDITVTAVNDAPSFTKGADETVLEDAGAQSVTGWATSVSAGASSESAQTLTFNITGNTNSALFSAGPAIASNGTLTYTPATDANGSATITVTLQDNGGTANGGVDTSASQSFTITVTAVNDAPSFAKGANQSVNEDSGVVSVAGWATSLSSGPSDESSQTRTFNITGNTNTGLFSSGPAVDGTTGNLSYTIVSGAFGTATVTLALQDNGGTANGGVDTSASQTFDIVVVEVPDNRSYTALAHTELAAGGFMAVGTVNTTSANGVLVGDASLSVTSTGPFASANGGTVRMASGGGFSYTPPPGVTGASSDSFSYTVNTGASATVTMTINGTPTWYVNNQAATGGNGTSTTPYDTLAAAATASSAGETIYVFEGDGTSTGYNAGVTLKNTQKLLGQGVDLVIGSTTLVTGSAGDRPLLRNATGTAVTLATGNEVAGIQIQNSLQGLGATTQSGTVSIHDMAFMNITNEEIDLLTQSGTVTIDNSTITGGGAAAILVDGGDAAITLNGVTLTNTGFPAVQIQNRTGGSLQFLTGTIVQTNAEAVQVSNSAGTYRFDNVTQTGSGTGISISSSATANFTFNTLSVSNAGAGGAMSLTNAGTVSVAGTSSLTNTAGPAISASNTTFDTSGGGGSAVFNSVSSSNSPSTGISLSNTGGTLTMNGGSVSNASGTAFNVSGGNPTVIYNGTIANTAGRSLVVENMTGGAVTFGSTLTDTGGTGVLIQGNALGSNEIRVTGTTTLTNTSGTAFTQQNNTSGTVRLATLIISNGTSNQRGIFATNNSAASLITTGGSVATGSGQAIDIDNTALTMSLTSVAVNGASTGVSLNTTTGSFSISGSGSTNGSGGTIQNITNNGLEFISATNVSLSNMTLTNANTTDGAGTEVYNEEGNTNARAAIYLRSVTGVTLTNVDINGTAEMGINGLDVRGFSLTNSSLVNCGNSMSESGILIQNLLGTTAGGDANLIQNTTIDNSADVGVFIRALKRTNAAPGAPDRLLMDSVSVTNSGNFSAADSVLISLRDDVSTSAGSNFQAVVQGCTFTGVTGEIVDAIQFDSGINATGDFSISNTTINNSNTGINITGSSASSTTFQVSNNTNVNVDGGNGVNLFSNGSAVMSGTVSNNTIDSFNANNPGFGIRGVVDATGSLTASVTGNNVTDFSIPITMGARGTGSGTGNFTITGNTMSSGGGLAFGVLHLFSGNGSGGESNSVCANISGNNFNDPFGTQEYYIEQYPGNTLNLQGYSGGPTDIGAIQTFLEGNNIAGDALVETCCGTSPNVGNTTCTTP